LRKISIDEESVKRSNENPCGKEREEDTVYRKERQLTMMKGKKGVRAFVGPDLQWREASARTEGKEKTNPALEGKLDMEKVLEKERGGVSILSGITS